MFGFFKKTVASLLLLSTVSQSGYAQTDADVAHFWSDRSYFNPAYIVPLFHFSLMARRQQIGFKGEPASVIGDVSDFRGKFHSLIGAQLRYDYAGYTGTGRADVRYAFMLNASERDFVNLGISGGIAFLNYDEDKIKVDNTNDAYLYERDDHTSPNCSVGVEWIHLAGTHNPDEFTLGASIINMEDMFNWTYKERLFVNSVYGYASYRKRAFRSFKKYNVDLYGGLMGQYYDLYRLHGEAHAALILSQFVPDLKSANDAFALGATYRHNFRGYGSSDLLINAGVAPMPRLFVGVGCDVVLGNHTHKAFTSVECFIEYKLWHGPCVDGALQKTIELLGGK